MIQSMTGFARAEAHGDWGSIVWECRTVNHRYFEMGLRLPEPLRCLEPQIREKSRQVLTRGKLDCSCRYSPGNAVDVNLKLNTALVSALDNALGEIATHNDCEKVVRPYDILRWPGVVEVNESLGEQAKSAILVALNTALAQLKASREQEGASLAHLILARVDDIKNRLVALNDKREVLLEQQRERLTTRIQELQVELDSERLDQEIAMLAQKIDIAEECDRLSTHMQEIERILKKGGTVGRRLDFLIQECHREANTIGAKSVDASVTNISVDCKVFIEQMREQVQNIA